MARLEKELRDREVGGAELLRRVLTVGGEARRPRVWLRVCRDRNREVAQLADELDEIDREVELAFGEIEIDGRITAQREDVLDPRVAVAKDDLAHLDRKS